MLTMCLWHSLTYSHCLLYGTLNTVHLAMPFSPRVKTSEDRKPHRWFCLLSFIIQPREKLRTPFMLLGQSFLWSHLGSGPMTLPAPLTSDPFCCWILCYRARTEPRNSQVLRLFRMFRLMRLLKLVAPLGDFAARARMLCPWEITTIATQPCH